MAEPDCSGNTKKRKKKKEEEKVKKKRQLSKIDLDQFSLVNGSLKVYDFVSGRRLLINDSISVRVDDVELELNKMQHFADAFSCSDFFVDSYRSELTPLKGYYEFGLACCFVW